jgi:CRP/FNR family transcriptional regulator, anaerobic regulatory protein
MMASVRPILLRFYNFSDEELEAFQNICSYKVIAARTILYEPGESSQSLLLIKYGIIRNYSIVEGSDCTDSFFTDNEFVVDYKNFLANKESPLFVETVLQTEFFSFFRSDFENLCELFPKLQYLRSAMAEQFYLAAANKLRQYVTGDIKTCYGKLISANPLLFRSVPREYIASYLGVTPKRLRHLLAEIEN